MLEYFDKLGEKEVKGNKTNVNYIKSFTKVSRWWKTKWQKKKKKEEIEKRRNRRRKRKRKRKRKKKKQRNILYTKNTLTFYFHFLLPSPKNYTSPKKTHRNNLINFLRWRDAFLQIIRLLKGVARRWEAWRGVERRWKALYTRD